MFDLLDKDTVIPETQDPQSENDRFSLEDFDPWESGIGYRFWPLLLTYLYVNDV